LVQHHKAYRHSRIASEIDLMRDVEENVLERLGIRLTNLRMLDVGAGQHLIQMAYFAARGNNVIGVDRDAVVQSINIADYLRMARSNGFKRATKTIGRKVLGVDLAYRRELERQLGSPRRRERLSFFQMDATNLDFPDGDFDFVYSLRVFQHVEEPLKIAREIARVIAPGGGAYIDFLPYSAINGSLDLRLLAGREVAPWAHLRRQYQDSVQESAYVNKLRLDSWDAIFADAMPGSRLVVDRSPDPERRALVQSLIDSGELGEFTPDELLATRARVFWHRLRA